MSFLVAVVVSPFSATIGRFKMIQRATFLGSCTTKLFSDDIITDKENEDFSMFGRGINFFDGGQYDKSVAVFDTIIQHSPDNRRAIYSRGQAYEKQKNYLQAIQDYSSIIEDGVGDSKIKTLWLGSEAYTLQHKPLFSYENDIQWCKNCNIL